MGQRGANRTKCDYCSPVARPFKGTSRSRAPPIRTIRPTQPTSKNAKETIWRERFGGHGLFAFSGCSNAGSAPCATPRSPGSRAGAFTIASPVCRVVPPVQTIASCFIQSATTGFTATIFPYRNRLSLKEAFEGLEPDEAKVSRPVLRGPGPSNGARLLGVKADVAAVLNCFFPSCIDLGWVTWGAVKGAAETGRSS